MKPLKLLAALAAVCCLCPALPTAAQEPVSIYPVEESTPVLREVIAQENQMHR